MRLLEILLFGLVFVALIVRLLPNARKWTMLNYLPLAAGILIPIHLLIEGYRWQMVPIYIFTLGLIGVSIVQLNQRSKQEFLISNKILRTILIVFSFFIFVLAFVFPLLLPVVDLPEPGGRYAVGTTSFRMTDHNRKEVFTQAPDDDRSLLVTVWYPAEIDKGMVVSSYWDEKGITGETYSINADIGTFWYTHLALVKTNSYRDAPLSAEKESYPVIVYSHSFYGLNTENTILLEELASNGYIVFSIAHSFETIVSIFPDGEVVPGNLDYISELFDSNVEMEEQLYLDYQDAADMEEKTALVEQILVVDELSNQLVKTRTEDAIFVLDEIERLNSADGIFKTRLDLERVGIMGWSFGGATAGEACIADSRFKAGINIDGWPYGALFNSDKMIAQPFMTIRSEAEDEIERIVSDLVFEKIDDSAYLLTIEDAWHTNFWDFPLFFKVYTHFGYWGPIDPPRLSEINKAYTVGFFNEHLKGEDVDLEKLSDCYPEVTIRVRHP